MRNKDSIRKAILVFFTINVLSISYVAFFSPFIAASFVSIIISLTIAFFAFSLYLFDFKNIKGWWTKKWFEARQRAEHKRAVEARVAKERGMGYDKLPQG